MVDINKKLQIENQKKDPGFNKKSKEMTEKMLKENFFKNFNKGAGSDRKSNLLEKIMKNTSTSKGLKAGGRVEYKSGGGVGCAKRGFNKKILKKGKK